VNYKISNLAGASLHPSTLTSFEASTTTFRWDIWCESCNYMDLIYFYLFSIPVAIAGYLNFLILGKLSSWVRVPTSDSDMFQGMPGSGQNTGFYTPKFPSTIY
jgi:hypothetical protein